MYQVTKRDGTIAQFEIGKISAAITKAFEALEKQYHPSVIDMLALRVTADFEDKIRDGLIAVEDSRTAWRQCSARRGTPMWQKPISSTVSSGRKCAMWAPRCSTIRIWWITTSKSMTGG